MRKIIKSKVSIYYYHVTPKNLGSSYIFVPRKIVDADEREPDIKRVCVAPSISCCFSAIYPNGYSEYFVYRTKNKVRASCTYNVYDVSVTKEKWLLSPTEFIRIAKIRDVSDYPCSSRGDEDYLKTQKRDREKIKNIISNRIKDEEEIKVYAKHDFSI